MYFRLFHPILFQLWLLIVPILIACNREQSPDCFKSSGIDETEIRYPGDFSRIELRDYIHIELVHSDAQYVEVTGPRNLLNKIESGVKDGTLYIRNKNTCNFVRSFKRKITVRIFSPSFPDIQNYGTGNVTALNTLHGSHFKIENRDAAGIIDITLDVDTASILTHTGVSDVKARGHANVCEIFSQGVGTMDTSEMNCKSVFVNNSSINDVRVRCTDYLFCFIRFSGNVYCTGSPASVDQDIQGSGDLIFTP